MNMEAHEHEKLDRLLSGKFSGNVQKMYDALNQKLKTQETKKEDLASLSSNGNRAVFLRSFIKGHNQLRSERISSQDVSDSDNLFNFPNVGSRSSDLLPLELVRHGNDSVLRLPLPSIASVAKHILPRTEVKIIRSKHLRILKLDLSGKFSRKEIAKIVGCSEPTVTNVLSTPAIQEFKRRSQRSLEDEYSTLMKPAIAAVRDALKEGVDLELRQDTAFKYLKTQGRGGVPNVIQHQHEHTGKGGGPIQVSDVKKVLLTKLGYDPKEVLEAEYREIEEKDD